MNIKELMPYIIAILSGIGSWIGSYAMATKKAKQDINTLKIQNEHDIEKLMSQHKLDLDALKEKHKLEIETKMKEHEHKLEIIQKEHENELIRKEKELEDTAKYGAIKDLMGGVFGNMLGSAVNTPEMQEMISSELKKSLKNQGGK